MVKNGDFQKSIILSNLLRGASFLTFLFLLIEFFDELNYGVETTAIPAIRSDLGLSYVQVGLLLSVPGIINIFIEPFIMLLGDTPLRKRIMLGGGMVIVVSLVAVASASAFPVVLFAMVLMYPASGAFVSLAQGTLMDQNPGREPHMMARWTLAGSLANLIGPLILAAGFALGFGWRWLYYGVAVLCLVLVIITWVRPLPRHHDAPGHQPGEALNNLWHGLWEALRHQGLLRWMVLLQFSDLLLDVLTGYLALYFTDVIGLSIAQASLMMSILMAASLVSHILLIPILEKFPGRKVVRISAAAAVVLYAAWLLAPWLWAKLSLIIVIKLVSLGWYEVLDGETFATIPGRSGTVMAIGSVFNLLMGGISFFIGWVAAQAGLPAAMWIMLLGPVVLVLFVPREKPAE